MDTVNNTIEIPGYAYKVTLFTYDEACKARDAEFYENDLESANAMRHNGGDNFVVLCFDGMRYYYL